jgi:hypothetical protein
LSGVPVGLTFMPFIMDFVAAAKALSAAVLAAGFVDMFMPFMSSARMPGAPNKTTDMPRAAARSTDIFKAASY